MHIHPEIRNVLAQQKHRDMVVAAERSRSLALARRGDRDAAWHMVERMRERAGHEITMRPAAPADTRALADLAILDDASPLAGDVLVAEVAGELWAACSLADGRTLGHPFRPTQSARALLALRREQLAAADRCATSAERRGLRWLRQLRFKSAGA
jgi:hypothetical protein